MGKSLSGCWRGTKKPFMYDERKFHLFFKAHHCDLRIIYDNETFLCHEFFHFKYQSQKYILRKEKAWFNFPKLFKIEFHVKVKRKSKIKFDVVLSNFLTFFTNDVWVPLLCFTFTVACNEKLKLFSIFHSTTNFPLFTRNRKPICILLLLNMKNCRKNFYGIAISVVYVFDGKD